MVSVVFCGRLSSLQEQVGHLALNVAYYLAVGVVLRPRASYLDGGQDR